LAAIAGKRVVLFESQRLGSTSLNSGSVPSKALIRSATLFAAVREASRLMGSEGASPVADLGRLATRLRRIEQRIASYHSLSRLSRLGIDTRFAAAVRRRRTITAGGQHVRFAGYRRTGGLAPAQFQGSGGVT
jgi:pyruvate/2-oxoglutarate dehydrogenase complex dihydrolipoamide dehydrogenase (E3) component